MKFSATRSFITLFASLTIISLAGLDAHAQMRIGQNWFGNAYSRSGSDVQSLYNSNARRPLGGLFAPGFTRTLTILGGLNFPSAGTEDIFGTTDDSLTDALLPFPFTNELEETGYALSFAFGRRHSRSLRSEIEVAVRGNDIVTTSLAGVDSPEESGGTVNAISLMKNFIIDFDNNSRFTPYAGAGLGLSYVEVDQLAGVFPALQEGETLFSYQAIGGVATQLTTSADFIVEYRFLGTSEVEFDELGQTLAYNTSNLFFGVKLEY